MTSYVAFLRAVNVGGNSIVSMAAIREAVAGLGLAGVRTYINSGNVLFAAREAEPAELAAQIEAALEERTGLAIRVLVVDHEALEKLVAAIPETWLDDATMRTYVLLLWKEVDELGILERLPARPGVDELIYVPGAVVWRVDRVDVGRSHMNRLAGTPLYKRMTMRSANTVRRLAGLSAGTPQAASAQVKEQ